MLIPEHVYRYSISPYAPTDQLYRVYQAQPNYGLGALLDRLATLDYPELIQLWNSTQDPLILPRLSQAMTNYPSDQVLNDIINLDDVQLLSLFPYLGRYSPDDILVLAIDRHSTAIAHYLLSRCGPDLIRQVVGQARYRRYNLTPLWSVVISSPGLVDQIKQRRQYLPALIKNASQAGITALRETVDRIGFLTPQALRTIPRQYLDEFDEVPVIGELDHRFLI